MTTYHITQAMANPEIIAELGRRFKEYRLTYRFTQKEAAEKAGVSLITTKEHTYRVISASGEYKDWTVKVTSFTK